MSAERGSARSAQEDGRTRAELEELERGLLSILARLDDALRLIEQMRAEQRALFARLREGAAPAPDGAAARRRAARNG